MIKDICKKIANIIAGANIKSLDDNKTFTAFFHVQNAQPAVIWVFTMTCKRMLAVS